MARQYDSVNGRYVYPSGDRVDKDGIKSICNSIIEKTKRKSVNYSVLKVIAKYDFSVVSDNSIKDLSGNSYNAVLHNVVYDIQEHSVKLNGSGFIEIPIFTVIDPYAVKFKMKISSENTEKAILFSSKDAVIYFEKGKIFFERKGYTFCFNQEIQTDKWVDFEISSRDKKTVLCIDGAKTVEAEYIDGEYEYTPKTERIFYTLPFPINKIGEGIKGYISDFVITKG